MSIWDVIFDLPSLIEQGADAVIYFVMAGVGTLLFLLRLGFAMFGGADGGDFDAGDMGHGDLGGHDADGDASDASFRLLSVLSILAFFMGAGWMGLACRLDWGLSRFTSSVSSAGFGFAMMAAASGLAALTRKLNQEVEYDPKTAIGRTGRAYLTIPARGQGLGQVEVSVSGRRKILSAASTGGRIKAFTDVRVTGARDDETLLVEPLSSADPPENA